MTDSQTLTAPIAQAQESQTITESNSFDLSKYYTEDLKNDPDFERISKSFPNDPEKLVKDLYHKTKHFGKARDVVKAELEAELNKPAQYKPEDYSFDIPENYTIENELLDAAKLKAQALGVKPEIVKEIFKEVFNVDAQLTSKLEEAQKAQSLELEKKQFEIDNAAVESLRKEWGFNFEKKAEEAQKMFDRLSTAEENQTFNELPVPAKMAMLRMMDKVAQRVGEGSIGVVRNSDSYKSELDKIYSDPNHPYFKGDKKAIEYVFELTKKSL